MPLNSLEGTDGEFLDVVLNFKILSDHNDCPFHSDILIHPNKKHLGDLGF